MTEPKDIEEVYLEYLEDAVRRHSLYLGGCTFDDISRIVLKYPFEQDASEGSQQEHVDLEESRGENYEGWGILPDLLIEKVFGHLDIPSKYNGSRVCRQWERAFYMEKSWETFVLEDDTLTRHKFNYYMGWQLILDHLRAQMAILKIGRFIRNLVFAPMSNLFNLYEFMNLISYYAERYNEDKLSRAPLFILSLRFIFRCDLTMNEEQSVYGTGGKLLEGLKRLMGNLPALRNLELIDLMLDSAIEAIHLLDDVCACLCATLDRLVLINPTRAHFTLLHPACFVNLRILKITPQNIGSEMIELLCNNQQLQEVHLVQNRFTDAVVAVDRGAWRRAKFRVFLRTISKTDKEILWQPGAPVTSVIYDSPLTQINWACCLRVVDLYACKLVEYGHLGLPKFSKSKKFVDRADSALVLVARKCLNLETMFIRERLSTSTLLLISSLASNLTRLVVRKNGVLLKFDLAQHHIQINPEITKWIQLNAKSYDKVELEVGILLGQTDWKMFTDGEFKEISRTKEAY